MKSSVIDILKEKKVILITNFPSFKAGDTITVHYKIKEGDKERVQQFTGVVIQKKNHGATRTFTVRKMSNGVGVERIFQLNSPFIENIEIKKVGDIRRAKLYYLRSLTGKSARIQQRILSGDDETGAAPKEDEVPKAEIETAETK